MVQRTKKQCSIDGCERKHYGRGWCRNHYSQWYRKGHPLAMERLFTPEERFAARTKPQGGCVVWTGSLGRDGHGVMRIEANRDYYAHRYAWERENGSVPDGLQIDHKCHNPACVKTSHLRLATAAQNQANRKGAQAGSSSGVRNVHKSKYGWLVVVTKNGKRHYFGTYKTIPEAAKAAGSARAELFGEFAGRGE